VPAVLGHNYIYEDYKYLIMATTLCSVLTVNAATVNPVIDKIDVYRPGQTTPSTTVYTNEACKITVWLSNTGNTAVTGTLTLKVGSTQIGSQSNVTIPANTPVGQGYVEFPSKVISSTAGTYTLTATFTYSGGTITKTATITVSVPQTVLQITYVGLVSAGTSNEVSTINTGKYIDVKVTLRNTGTSATNYQVFILRDGTQIYSSAVQTINANTSTGFTFSNIFSSSTAGNFNICVYAKETNGAATANTCKPITVVVPVVPAKIEVTSVSLQNTTGIAGAANVVSYTIKNTGGSTAPANSHKIKISAGSTVLYEYTYQVALGPNESSSFTYNFNNPSTAGSYNICVDVIKL